MSLIERQAAIDAECEVCQIAPKKERGHNCTYYVHGCKEIECLRVLPSAQPDLQSTCNQLATDYVSRRAVIDAIEKLDIPEDMCVFEILSHIELEIQTLPSTQPEIIHCKDCKHYRGYTGIIDGYCYMAEWCKRYQHADDYCSRAERRIDE